MNLSKGPKGSTPKALVKYDKPRKKAKTGIHTYNRLRPCSQVQQVSVRGLEAQQNLVAIDQNWDHLQNAASSPVKANMGNALPTTIADERDLLIMKMHNLIQGYFQKQ